jgi:hypothetical protein
LLPFSFERLPFLVRFSFSKHVSKWISRTVIYLGIRKLTPGIPFLSYGKFLLPILPLVTLPRPKAQVLPLGPYSPVWRYNASAWPILKCFAISICYILSGKIKRLQNGQNI